MATAYKTPGVYIEEIPKFPPSIAPVETAIPAFIGYTQKAMASVPGDLLLQPTRITSMVEYEAYFGGAQPEEKITVTITESKDATGITSSLTSIASLTETDRSKHILYYAMQLFFANGGGPCYIISVGDFKTTFGAQPDYANDIVKAFGPLSLVDEPTLIVVPEAQGLTINEFKSLQDAALMQCATLKDRFVIMDLHGGTAGTNTYPVDLSNPSGNLITAVNNFRDNGVGNTNLKYGAVYAPNIETALDLVVNEAKTIIVRVVTSPAGIAAQKAMVAAQLAATNATSPALAISAANVAATAAAAVAAMDPSDPSTAQYAAGVATSALSIFVAISTHHTTTTTAAVAAATIASAALVSATKTAASAAAAAATDATADPSSPPASAVDATNASAAANAAATAIPPSPPPIVPQTATTLVPFNLAEAKATDAAVKSAAAKPVLKALRTSQNALYESARSAIRDLPCKMPPSSSVAGIYASVDNERGVWKAPANVSVNAVIRPTIAFSNVEQDQMNIDVVAGKSVNAIRAFTGKGTLVWGARTLAGNDNEWRYVSVRRFFNFVEESVKKATEQFVFEPNDANTWVRVQAMNENFLTTLWRQGALQGVKPEHAFYVAVGLGKTMTALDILEGRMIVEIGMAAVRPAEFIILRFSHKMAES